MKQKEKVLIALSGGVDSSVSAALLLEQGYDVTAAFMVNYNEHDAHGLPCYTADYRDAVRVAARLGIQIMKIDFTREYKEQVLDYMFNEYKLGRTPNPDVLCNKYIKFGSWLEKAKELGFDKLATGHYADLVCNNGMYKLMQAKDEEKDQTYFLHQLNQEQLSHTLFPLGKYTKTEVRALAEKFDLPTAQKEESMGICFIGEVPMKDFLQQHIAPEPGNIILQETGEIIGIHDGLAFYTIGQRHLGKSEDSTHVSDAIQKSKNQPLYVLEKNKEKNELVVGFENNKGLYKTEAIVESWHFTSGQPPANPLQCLVRLRHRQVLQEATIEGNKIHFKEPQKAVTPGQFAVLYKNNECLGGGIII